MDGIHKDKVMSNSIDEFDPSILTDRELESIKNLADFERKSLVIGEGIFNLLLPKVETEIQKRNEGAK